MERQGQSLPAHSRIQHHVTSPWAMAKVKLRDAPWAMAMQRREWDFVLRFLPLIMSLESKVLEINVHGRWSEMPLFTPGLP